MDDIDEQWLSIPRVKNRKNVIVAISNTGKYRKLDGTIGILGLRRHVEYYGKREKCSHIIAEHFLITVRKPDQTCIDHISHQTSEYYINDVRNLRWCTITENNNFEEAKDNKSRAMTGIRVGDKHPMWKGDDACASALYSRAKKLYKEGKISEEEFQPYRDDWAEYKRSRKMQTGVQHAESLQD